uniref:Uncharacterized protein n=1 Tax=Meloidogyne enterolobii TaxID=390850 RepID=A0A6V7Y5N1_MELEN|nr:unnamed protein product [Meloidogyne enterolobii]
MAFIYSLNCFPKSLQACSLMLSTDRHWQFCNSMFADACNKTKIYEATGKQAF